MPLQVGDLLSKVVIVVVTAIVSILSTLFFRKRKVLEYDVFSMPLLRFTPKKERMLAVTVDKFLLTGEEKDKGEAAPVTSAYGFEVDIRNVGNEEATEASVEITLHESAKIIEYETYPASRPSYEVVVERTSGNVLRLLVPYINKRDRFLIRIISTENEERNCDVDIRGLGIRSRRYSEARNSLRFVVSILIPIIFLALGLSLLQESIKGLGTTETVTTTKEVSHYPGWVIVGLIIYTTITVGGSAIYHFRNVPTRTKEYGSGGMIIVQDWDMKKRK